MIIPTHYLNETTTYTLSTLQPADEWVKAKNRFKLLNIPSISLAAKDIASLDRAVFNVGNHAATA
ncbi:hypothetical protein ACHMW7_19925 [Aminobacter sp. UC22_36]|uniref:hypothetical protein n=1 Tax=Aminobacter sp. UC22_36 TaxID=3374549 RepID=UPI00375705D5